MTALGRPRLHHREIDSTNRRARELASAGAPHGTLVTAGAQTAGRGRQGRRWEAPAGSALLCSLVLREFDALLSLRAGLAVADVAGEAARVKWPNDVQVDGRKVAGVLVEGRPHEGWAVVGIGVNVSAAPDLPEPRRSAATTSRRCWRSCWRRSRCGWRSRARRPSTPCARATHCSGKDALGRGRGRRRGDRR